MNKFNEQEQSLYEEAMTFVRLKRNKKKIAIKVVDQHPSEDNPVSVFMAGSPGAGKTEVAKSLVEG